MLRSATKSTLPYAGVLSLVFLSATSAQAILVPGHSNPWLAGNANGTTADVNDTAPQESPILAGYFSGGSVLTITATGRVAYDGVHYSPTPDGGAVVNHRIGAENGKSDVIAPLNSLIGVFLDASPGASTPPARLDFSTAASRNFGELHPSLDTPFFIGDGLNSVSAKQMFYAPVGSTRLYLGTMDGYSWRNNAGSFQVQVTPVPEPASLVAVGLGLAGCLRRRRRRR